MSVLIWLNKIQPCWGQWKFKTHFGFKKKGTDLSCLSWFMSFQNFFATLGTRTHTPTLATLGTRTYTLTRTPISPTNWATAWGQASNILIGFVKCQNAWFYTLGNRCKICSTFQICASWIYNWGFQNHWYDEPHHGWKKFPERVRTFPHQFVPPSIVESRKEIEKLLFEKRPKRRNVHESSMMRRIIPTFFFVFFLEENHTNCLVVRINIYGATCWRGESWGIHEAWKIFEMFV